MGKVAALVKGLTDAAPELDWPDLVRIAEEVGADLAKTEALVDRATASPAVQDWASSLQLDRFKPDHILVQSIDAWGPRIGFTKVDLTVTDSTGLKLPGVSLLRGGSVVIIVALECEGRLYAAITVQPRVPTGSFAFEEVSAGMVDGADDFAGAAAKELEQELGIKINKRDLIDLGARAGILGGIFTSPGLLDEKLTVYAYTKSITRAEKDELDGRITGELAEGETITVKVVPFEYLARMNDAKSLIAYFLYRVVVLGDIDVSGPVLARSAKKGLIARFFGFLARAWH
jgi:8-oxo-dGTP pyrophosphatase MutT (NUDIX family)